MIAAGTSEYSLLITDVSSKVCFVQLQGSFIGIPEDQLTFRTRLASLPVFMERLVAALDHVGIKWLDVFGNKHGKACDEIRIWENKLNFLRGVLRDVHERKSYDSELRLWLDDGEELAYDVEDMLEHLRYELQRRQQVELTRKRKFSDWFCNRMNSMELPSMLDSKWAELIQRKEEFFGRLSIAPSSTTINSRMEGPIPTETETVVYHRGNTKWAIGNFLLSPEQSLGVYPIVGMAGIGKTTLARYAYNSEYADAFTIKAWICISKDYDRVRAYKAIIEFVTSASCSLEDPAAIQWKVEEVLQGKKFLIVMDDLWEIDRTEWAALKSPLLKGEAGSKVIVTTQNCMVAETVRTVSWYKTVKQLSETESWELFCACVEVDGNENLESNNLEGIGRKIVAKVGGLPLAIRAVASLLRLNFIKEDWEAILNDTSSLRYKDEIMSDLRMRFDGLPYSLKRCFLFCTMFRQDYEIEEDKIVDLWLASGLIECNQEGRRNLDELVSRCLLSKSDGYIAMHCMIRAMGTEISRNIFCCWEAEIGSIERSRHLVFERSLLSEIIRSVRTVEKRVLPLRLIMSQADVYKLDVNEDVIEPLIVDENDVGFLFTKLGNARVVALPFCHLPRLPQSIGEMKLLRYLDLSRWTCLTTLPSEVGMLANLVKLDLMSCRRLIELPSEIGRLANLIHLNLDLCQGLTTLPSEIGSLTNLSELNLRACTGLLALPSQIGNLINLSQFELLCCEGLTRLPYGIGCLSKISKLGLNYCKSLKELPSEIGRLTSLSELVLRNCGRLTNLPSEIGKLRNLSKLDLNGCKGLTVLPSEIGMLVNLSELDLSNCTRLKVLPTTIKDLTNLFKLNLCCCIGLTALPPEIGELTDLSTLNLSSCKGLTELPPEIGELTDLSTLNLSLCEGLTALPPEIGELTGLHTLDLSYCDGLTALPPEIGELTGLRTLDLSYCDGLTALPPEIGQLSGLDTLDLRYCDGLTELPPEIWELTNLSTLSLSCWNDGLHCHLRLRI